MERKFYEIGKDFKLEKEKYEIVQHIGEGATCLVYRVKKENEFLISSIREIYYNSYILKEFWHIDSISYIERTKTGTLRIKSKREEDIKAFKEYLYAFLTANKSVNLFVEKADKNRNAIDSPENIINTYDENNNTGTGFSIYNITDGVCLVDNKPKTIKDLLNIILSIAKNLKILHGENRLYLDLKPDNIFINEEFSKAKFIDVDGLVDIGALKTKKNPNLPSSRGYRAPEQEPNNINVIPINEIIERLDIQTDFYLLGKVVDWCLDYAYYEDEYGNEKLHTMSMIKGASEEFLILLEKFLNKTINNDKDKRFKNDDELINTLERLLELSKHRGPSLRIESFSIDKKKSEGRKEDIEKVKSILEEKGKVFLFGMGGLGKSEIALQYIEQNKDTYKNIVKITYDDISLATSFLNSNILINFSFKKDNNSDKFLEIYNVLSSICDNETLILIDNFNAFKDDDLEKILNLNCRIIITTRNDFRSNESLKSLVYEVKEIKDICALKKIFKMHCDNYNNYEKTDPNADSTLEEIIKKIGSHTLAIVLLAKQFSRLISYNITLNDIKKKFNESLSNESKIEFMYENDKNTYFGHIKNIFSLSKIENDEKLMEVLRVIAFLPASGMDKKDFIESCGVINDESRDLIDNKVQELSEIKWIEENKETNIINMHPIIREVVFSKNNNFNFDSKLVNNYIEYILSKIKDKSIFLKDRLYLLSNLRCIANRLIDITDLRVAEICFNMVELLFESGKISEMKKYLKRFLEIKNQDPKLSVNDITIKLLGDYCNCCSMYNEALELHKKWFSIVSSNYIKNGIAMAKARLILAIDYVDLEKNALAGVECTFAFETLKEIETEENIDNDELYSLYELFMIFFEKSKNFKSAIEFVDNMISLMKEKLNRDARDTRDFIRCYNRKAYYHCELGEYEEAIKGYENVIEILEKEEEIDNKKLARLYDDKASSYKALGEYEEAKKSYDKAIELHEKEEEIDNKELANVYKNKAYFCTESREHEEAIKNYDKAIELLKKEDEIDNRKIATVYNNKAHSYTESGEYKEAIKNYDKAIELHEKEDEIDNKELARLYNNRAFLYFELGEYGEVIKNYDKAIEIYEKEEEIDNKELARLYNDRACLYSKLGEYGEVIKNYDKAIEILEKEGEKYSKELVGVYNNKGISYAKLGEYEEAKKSYDKAIEIYEKEEEIDNKELSRVYNNKASLYAELGEHEEAKKSYDKAIEIYEKEEEVDNKRLADVYNSRGIFYAKLGKNEEVIKNYDKVIELLEKEGKKYNKELVGVYNNKGISYAKLGEYKEAIKNYDKAIELHEKGAKIHNKKLNNVYFNKAFCYEKLHEKEDNIDKEALAYDNLGLQEKTTELLIRDEFIDNKNLAINYNKKAINYIKSGEYKAAIENYQKAIEILEGNIAENKTELIEIYQNIENAFKSCGEPFKAFKYSQKAKKLKK